ncbi:MAG: VOC family protein [Actinobacteria bacterium]|nr:VOC family protein [Actinomycetota bacterium]
MERQLQVGYIEIEVPEPSALSSFFGEVIGLVSGEPADRGALTWRDDDRAQRVIISPGAANDVAAVGFEATDDAAFDATIARLRSAGFEPRDGSADDREARRVARLASVDAPWGTPVEVVTDLAAAVAPFESELVPGGFFTEGVGFGHVVIATTAFDESVRFLSEGLGLVRSDWLEMELAPGIELVVHFFHCNERHHSVALAHAPFELPQKLHHIMFETNERDDVGAAFDRAWASDLNIPNGLGRHDNDGMFSFYVESPAGFQVEVGHGARVVTDDWDDDRRYDRISAWGHQPLRQA